MENSRTPLRKWFIAIYLFASSEDGVSAINLSHTIQVTYKTAWLMLHKLRDALDQAECDPLLNGIVRVQGGAYGSPFNPYTEKDPQRHPLLAGGSVHDTGEVDVLRLRIIDPQHVQPNGYISHDGEQEFIKDAVSLTAAEVKSVRFRLHRSCFRPLVRCIAEFSSWANLTFHGLGRKYLQAYANEFTFRYNSRQQRQPLLARIFQICSNQLTPTTLRSLTQKYRIS
ncbi:hypothetical protein [Paenibacillus kobensis]|uniref:hypothetical protein n=1 Tax=Paenibacillus kobensis TaxID=59841 RepID=UPI001FE9CE1C|nr:hypothetical protein [Paenibacillus kobensis]